MCSAQSFNLRNKRMSWEIMYLHSETYVDQCAMKEREISFWLFTLMYTRWRIPLANASSHIAYISMIIGNRECPRLRRRKNKTVHRLNKFVLPTRAMFDTYCLSDPLIFSTKEKRKHSGSEADIIWRTASHCSRTFDNVLRPPVTILLIAGILSANNHNRFPGCSGKV